MAYEPKKTQDSGNEQPQAAAAPAPAKVTVVKANTAADGGQVLVEDMATAHLLDRGNVSISSLPREYKPADFGALPKTGRRITRTLCDPKKTQIEDDETIQDINPQFKYLYLGAKEMRDPNNLAYDRHFIPVVRGNDGAAGIPASYFDDSGLVRQRENVLVYCDMGWWKSRIKVEKEPIQARLDTIANPVLRRRQSEGGSEVTQSLEVSEVR
jgi:hypothetical protein